MGRGGEPFELYKLRTMVSGAEQMGLGLAIDAGDDRITRVGAWLRRMSIDELPMAFRTVFVMREVEDMTVDETAECLSIPAATVRTRLFRARALLREALARDMDMATVDVFGFAGECCDRIVAGVLARALAVAPGSSGDAR